MKVDPEGAEMKAVQELISFKDKDVLEIGCGEGRQTFQIAETAKSVVAVDPSAKAITSAWMQIPKLLAKRIAFRVGRGEDLALPANSFDMVFMGTSLCCTDVPAQGRSIMEAWRVLRDGGELVATLYSLHQPFYNGMVLYLVLRGVGQPDWFEPERQARMALKHACYVERKFRFVSEKLFPVYNYYASEREMVSEILKDNGLQGKRLEKEARQGISEILKPRRTKKGIRFQGYQVATVLRKRV